MHHSFSHLYERGLFILPTAPFNRFVVYWTSFPPTLTGKMSCGCNPMGRNCNVFVALRPRWIYTLSRYHVRPLETPIHNQAMVITITTKSPRNSQHYLPALMTPLHLNYTTVRVLRFSSDIPEARHGVNRAYKIAPLDSSWNSVLLLLSCACLRLCIVIAKAS
jgi:hypothetical protein